MTITVRYGVDAHQLTTANQPTFGQVKSNQTCRVVLGYGDNVRAMLDGVEQPDNALVPDGAIVTLETRCNTKATQ